MDTSLDNNTTNNNPFAISNGSGSGIGTNQKTDGLLLNLTENFKKNGQDNIDLSPTSGSGDYYNNSNDNTKNGKNLKEFDDDDDGYLGPETDVDGEWLPPSSNYKNDTNIKKDGGFNPFELEKQDSSEVMEKAGIEIDFNFQKQKNYEFDDHRLAREETPTPPADAVHDGGIEDNVADSGEESEDEWNYIKGEESDKEEKINLQPDAEVAELTEESDNMSQLNPNAAEFVPVSPTRSIPSPACRNLLNDPVISHSPSRPTEIDIQLPEPEDFDNEVKSKPSEIELNEGLNINGHENSNDQKSPNQETIENLLNGKNIDEIPEFQPSTTTPTKVPLNEEFHFGPNATPFTPAKLMDQSDFASSTRAVFGDETIETIESFSETNQTDNNNFISNKEQDPMSMSFYQTKGDDDNDEDIDLNKVHVLPENLSEFLNEKDKLQTTDLDEKENLPPSKENISCDFLPKSNNQEFNNLCDFLQSEPINQEPTNEPSQQSEFLLNEQQKLESEILNNPFMENKSDNLLDTSKSKSPEPFEKEETELQEKQTGLKQESDSNKDQLEENEQFSSSDKQQTNNEFIKEEIEIIESPTDEIEPEAEIIPVNPVVEPVCDEIVLPVKETVPIVEPNILKEKEIIEIEEVPSAVESESEPELQPDDTVIKCESKIEQESLPESEQVLKSKLILEPEQSEELCDLSHDDDKISKDESLESQNEVTSSIKDAASPLVSPIPDDCKNVIPETTSSFVDDESKLNNTNDSIKTDEVRSFLETEEIVSPISPLNSLEPKINLEQPMIKCDLLESTKSESSPLQQQQPEAVEVKTETILPEFAQTAIVSPIAETSTLKEKEEKEKKPVETPVSKVDKPKEVKAKVDEKKKIDDKKPIKKTPAAKKSPTPTAPKTTKPSTTTTSLTKPKTTLTKLSPTTTTTTATKTTKSPVTTTKSPSTKATTKPISSSLTKTTTERKPLTNGDIKTTTKSVNLAAKRTVESTVKRTVSATSSTSRTTTTTTTLTTAKASPTKTRPTTAPTKTTTNGAVPKAKPSTLKGPTPITSKTSLKAPTTKPVAATSPTKPPTSTLAPRTRPTTAPIAKPRVALTRPSSTTKTSADNEKQIKESANKLTALKSQSSKTAMTKKSEATAIKARTITKSTTSTTTTKTSNVNKKPAEITRNITKTTKIEKPQQNGITTVVTEQITTVNLVNNAVVDNNDPPLLKDNSPIIDNKLITETTND